MGRRESSRENRREVFAAPCLRNFSGAGPREPRPTARNRPRRRTPGRRSFRNSAIENRRRGPRRIAGKTSGARRYSFEQSRISRLGRERQRRGWSRTHRNFALDKRRRRVPLEGSQHLARRTSIGRRRGMDPGQRNAQLRARRGLGYRNGKHSEEQGSQIDRLRTRTRAENFGPIGWTKGLRGKAERSPARGLNFKRCMKGTPWRKWVPHSRPRSLGL